MFLMSTNPMRKIHTSCIRGCTLGLLCTLTGLSSAQTCTPVEFTKIIPADTQTLDRFGRAVAVSGDFAIIGAYHDADNGINAGTAYIYQFNGTSWVRVRKFVPNDVGPEDRFGTSVSIDGDVAIVGTVYDSDLGSRSGSAYIFRFDGTTWRFDAKLLALDGAIDDRFGRSVSINGDVAVIGAIWDDDNGIDSGSAYVFRYNGTSWVEEAKLIASDGATLDKFGWSASMDDNLILIGAKWSDVNGIDSGAAYIYRYDGATWTQEAKLAPADGELDDHFGYSVAIEGANAIIGTTWDGDNGLKAGAAYAYHFDGASWTQETKLLPDDGLLNDRFGYSVSISGDRAVVGSFAHADNGIDAGSAYLFMHDDAGWVQQGELLASDGEIGDHFGRSVAISGDNIFVGAYFDNDAGLESGSAYVFNVECTQPCIADLTGDGILNFFDVSAFLSAFSSQAPAADFTGDGVWNFFDVSAFLQAFSAGCS